MVNRYLTNQCARPIVHLFLLILACFLSFFIFSQEVLAANEKSLGKSYDVYIDESNQVTINDLLTNETNYSFAKSQSEYPYFDYTTATIWLRLNPNDYHYSSYDWIEFIDKVETLDIYYIHPDHSYHVQNGGLKHLEANPISFRAFLFPIPNEEIEQIYVKLQSTDLPISVTSAMYTNNELTTYVKNYKLLSGVFYGFMLALVLYNLFLFFSLKEQAYLLYTLFTFSFMILQACINSVEVEYLGEVLPYWLLRDSISYASLTICITMILFGRAFLETKKYIPLQDSLLVWMLRISTINLLAFQLIPVDITQFTTPLLVFIVSLTLWIAAIRVMLDGNRMARFYLVGWTFLLTTIIIQALSYLDIIPFHKYSFELIPQLAACLEGLFLSLALADKINLIKKEREAEQQMYTNKLLAADKAKDDFLFRTSHELKTPLHGIINITQSVLEQHDDREVLEENLKIIRAAGERMTNTVNDLLDMAKLKENKLHIKTENVDLHDCVKNVLELLRFIAQEKQVEIDHFIHPKAQYVIADNDRVIQILYNLIHNSMKHTEIGSIVVSSENREASVLLHIEDTGKGIPLSFHKKLFQPYEQAANINNRMGSGGTGLGLSISKQLAQQMHGNLVLSWSEEGKGSRFTLILPKANTSSVKGEETAMSTDATFISSSSDPKPLINESKRDKHRILIVDDEVINTLVLQRILPSSDFITQVAYSGTEALTKLETFKPNLILLDVMLPDQSGYEVSKQIREHYSLIELPILFVTVRDSIQDIQTAFQTGGNDYVTKPFKSEEIRMRVKNLLEMKQLTHQAKRQELAILRTQIKPHFLFNAINVIMYVCSQNSAKGIQLLGSFSEYLRHVLQASSRDFVPLSSELDFVEAYVTLEQARYQNTFTFKQDIDDSLLAYQIPILSIQPLIENAIKHGIIYHREEDYVSLTIRCTKDNKISVTIVDNGVGFDNASTTDQSGHHIGIANIKKRLQSHYGESITIKNRMDTGTIVQFTIPKQLPPDH